MYNNLSKRKYPNGSRYKIAPLFNHCGSAWIYTVQRIALHRVAFLLCFHDVYEVRYIHITASMDADNIVAKKNANESLEIDRNSRKLGKYLTKRK